jgi:predicted  nucleic acid-binding Zn-ribbon protein
LTLYTLEQQEQIEALKVANTEIENLKKQMAALQIKLELLNNK